jgi:hypothetical protein
MVQGFASYFGVSGIRLGRLGTAKRMIRIFQAGLAFHAPINLVHYSDRDMEFSFLAHHSSL